MANQEQLDILKQGVKKWNEWREENRHVEIDLCNADLLSANLTNANLIGANLNEATLIGANLSEAKLSRANLTTVNLSYAYLNKASLNGTYLLGTNLHKANLTGAYLGEASLCGADLSDADFSQANFSGAILREVKLSGANLNDTDFSQANLSGVDLRGASLKEARLRGATLSEANLSRVDLSESNLSRANLHKANLSYAHLGQADLNQANLSHAKLRGAYLAQADLARADLSGATLAKAIVGWTSFGDVDLSKVKGLETVVHNGRSTIGIDTIYNSQGNIPEAFLKGAGVDDTFITYICSLVGKPIEFYSCFISYSSKDDAFARRLYADLQSHNVRCWFAPEDMKIGDKIRPRLVESIRNYDKLLLVLSEYSVASKWVEFEVEAAMDKEQEGKPPVLFPVRLDNTVMESTTAWAAHIKRTRHIGDFTHWKDHDAYQKAFTHLLRDLKSDPMSGTTSGSGQN